MDDTNITPDTLPKEGGEGAVGSVEQGAPATEPTEGKTEGGDVANLSLKEINSILNKDFKDKDTALKSIKDTFSYVGKKSQDIEGELKEKGYMTRQELEDALFYRDNPQHAGNKKLLDALAKSENVSLSEASKLEAYTQLVDKASKFEEVEKSKSVMEPNPRLAAAMEKTSSVQELRTQGRIDDARTEAAKAVIEAYGM